MTSKVLTKCFWKVKLVIEDSVKPIERIVYVNKHSDVDDLHAMQKDHRFKIQGWSMQASQTPTEILADIIQLRKEH